MKTSHVITFVSVWIVLTSCVSKPAIPAQEEYGPYTIRQIDNNIWHLRDCNSDFPPAQSLDADGNPRYNNCSDMYLVVGKRKALLIDLSNHITWHDSAEVYLRHIVSKRVGKRPLVITFTHNHGDHVGMLPAYVNVPDVQFALPRIDFEDRLDMFSDATFYLFDEGHTFDLGGINIHTILVPGHTRGSMVFDCTGRNILLTGDAIGSGNGVWIFDHEGLDRYRKAVPHLIEYILSPENGIDTCNLRIYGGHYHQKDGYTQGELGMTYLRDMQQAIIGMDNGTAETAPFEFTGRTMDTYYIYRTARIAAPHVR